MTTAAASLRVEQPGPLCTMQDQGRSAAARYGVPASGAMDQFALAAANRLLDNPPDAAALEVTAGSATLTLLAATPLAITGADLQATLHGWRVPPWCVVRGLAGMQVRFWRRGTSWGGRAYLAVPGGFAVPPVLGSRSTYLAGGFGGLDGRMLRSGDVLAALPTTGDPAGLVGRVWAAACPPYRANPTLRLLPGPHARLFDHATHATLTSSHFTISSTSNRMGYRLESPTPLLPAAPVSIPSLGVVPGVVQVPPDGQPILLMADAQTTGGYPIIGVVIGADLPLAAQLLPGDTVQFASVDLATANAARQQMHQWLATPPHSDPTDDTLLAVPI